MFNFSLTFTPERENPIWPPRAIYGHTNFFLWQIYVKSFFPMKGFSYTGYSKKQFLRFWVVPIGTCVYFDY